jgi:hypothetical protein
MRDYFSREEAGKRQAESLAIYGFQTSDNYLA